MAEAISEPTSVALATSSAAGQRAMDEVFDDSQQQTVFYWYSPVLSYVSIVRVLQTGEGLPQAEPADELLSQADADAAEAAARRDAARDARYYPRDPRAVPLADEELTLQVLRFLMSAARLDRKTLKKGVNESVP